MKLNCEFYSNGEVVTMNVYVNNDLSMLLENGKNDATEIIDETSYDGRKWGVYCAVSSTLGYELVFECEDGMRTTTPVKAITWAGKDASIIDDVQEMEVW